MKTSVRTASRSLPTPIGTLTNVLEIDSMDDDIAVVLKAGDSVVVSEDSGD